MNIVFLISSLDSGGAERVAATLCNAWAARGDSVTLVATYSGGGKPFYKISSSVDLIYLSDTVGYKKKTFFGYFKRLASLRRIISDRRPEVVVSFLPNVNVAAIISTAFLRVPLIICERRDPSSQPCSKLWEVACRLFYRFADMLTVQTEDAAKRIGGIYPGVKAYRTISNPLPEEIVGKLSAIRGARRKVLVSVGRLAPEKQFATAIETFFFLANRYGDWDFHIYGEGPLRSNLERQVASLGLEGRIILMGRTKHPWKIMAEADAFIMTSRYEGFPNALLEAMGIGLPCVVFDCPSGPSEITRDGEDAFLVALNDKEGLLRALDMMMSGEKLRTELGSKARKSIIDRYRLSAVLEKWDELFREVGVSI